MRSHAKAASAQPTHRENAAFSLGVLAAMLVCAAAFLGIGAPAANAAPEAQPGYGYVTTFAQGEVANFTRARSSIAVDSTGKIFAPNTGSGLIRVYAPDQNLGGTPLTTLETYVDNVYADDVAVDPSTDALYAQDVANVFSIRRYISDGQPTPTYTIDPTFEIPPGEGLAVDPTSNDILVADPGAEGVHRYDTTGALVETIPTPGMGPQRIAVAADGSFYVSQEGNPSILHFSGAGTLLNEVQDAGEVKAIVVDPAGDLVVSTRGHLETFSPSGHFRSETASPSGNIVSLAVDAASGRLYGYVGAVEVASASIEVYDSAIWPGAEGFAVSNVTPHSAHFSAEVDPGTPLPAGSEARFEYSADGGKTWKSTPAQALTGPSTVEADVTGLLANFDYDVRFVASNALTSHRLAAVEFSTPEIAPEVATKPATDITETSAVLNGTVNPAGLQTTWHFEYGTTTSYGTRVPAQIDASAGDARSDRAFSRTITGLHPGTTYHFRIVAENAIGVTEGADGTFTTSAAGEIPVRGYEQVSPVDKHGNPLELFQSFQAAADGSAITYGYRGGLEGSPELSRFSSARSATAWGPERYLDPPLYASDARVIRQTTLAVSDDFTHTLVATNAKLTDDAIETRNGVNLYIGDIATRAWTFVGSAEQGIQEFISTQKGEKFFAGAPDFSWVVFKSTFPLLPGAPFFGLYRWSAAGGLEVVSLLPNGDPVGVDAPPISRVRSVNADGSRIYFTAQGGAGVFLREGGETSVITHPEGEPEVNAGGGLVGTSEDGRYAFVYSSKLTSDAPESQGLIYRYDRDDDSLEYLGSKAQAATQMNVGVGVGREGNIAYWRDESTNEPYVEVWREGEGVKTAIAGSSLPEGAFVSPDGRYLAYDQGNQGAATDVFLYDSQTGESACVSCLPDGSPSKDGFLPLSIERSISNYFPRVVNDQGQMFFTTSGRLVAADVNGTRDVYQFANGKPSLVSPGRGRFDAVFADASEDGSDIFFTTQQKLVGQDDDGSPDLYDARIGGGLAGQNPPPPQECLRDDCKATPGAGPELPFGGSEALSGPGNVKPVKQKKCGRGRRAKKVNGKVRCVKKHRTHKRGKGGNR